MQKVLKKLVLLLWFPTEAHQVYVLNLLPAARKNGWGLGSAYLWGHPRSHTLSQNRMKRLYAYCKGAPSFLSVWGQITTLKSSHSPFWGMWPRDAQHMKENSLWKIITGDAIAFTDTLRWEHIALFVAPTPFGHIDYRSFIVKSFGGIDLCMFLQLLQRKHTKEQLRSCTITTGDAVSSYRFLGGSGWTLFFFNKF